MTWIPRTARAVAGTAAACLHGGVGALLGTGAAVAVEAPVRVSAGEVTPRPQSFSFDGMSPGQTRSTLVDLASTHESEGAVVGIRTTTSGELAGSLSTSVEACSTSWEDGYCPTGAAVLLEGWRGDRAGTAQEEVVLPAGGTTWLKVSVTLDDDVAPGAVGAVRYDLSLQETEGDRSPGGGTAGPDGASGGGADGTLPPGASGRPASGPLAITGTALTTLAAVAGVLLGAGAALVRRRRDAVSGPAPGDRSG